MINMKNVLVATDFSDVSDTVISYGRQLARNFGARLHLVHVVDNPMLWSSIEGVTINVPAILAELQEAAGERLRKRLTEQDRVDLQAKAVVLTGNVPAYAIVDYAKEANIDLIVMGTHGRGMVAHLLLGSVAEKVLRLAPCPVLTVKNREREFVMPDALQVAVAVNP